VNSFILHEGFIVGYLFALLGVALFILQSIIKIMQRQKTIKKERIFDTDIRISLNYQ
jgi:uncharacterized membrane protein YciS (DUF1049 family)